MQIVINGRRYLWHRETLVHWRWCDRAFLVAVDRSDGQNMGPLDQYRKTMVR